MVSSGHVGEILKVERLANQVSESDKEKVASYEMDLTFNGECLPELRSLHKEWLVDGILVREILKTRGIALKSSPRGPGSMCALGQAEFLSAVILQFLF